MSMREYLLEQTSVYHEMEPVSGLMVMMDDTRGEYLRIGHPRTLLLTGSFFPGDLTVAQHIAVHRSNARFVNHSAQGRTPLLLTVMWGKKGRRYT